MKLKLSIWLLTNLIITTSFAQLDINPMVQIGSSEKDVKNFIKGNNLEEVIIAWKSSNWLALKNTFYALLKQNKKYFLAKITSDMSNSSNCSNYLVVDYCNVTKAEFEKYIHKELKISDAFKYTQKDFDQIPEECTLKQGEKTIEISVYDRKYWHLLTNFNDKTLSLKKYAPDFFLQYCEKYNPEYNILRGFAEAHHQLIKLVETKLSLKTSKKVVIKNPIQLASTSRETSIVLKEELSLKAKEEARVYQFFNDNTPWETVQDTDKIYAFAFKALVKKNIKGKAEVIELSANDPIAYQLYPRYKFLAGINYGLFMKNRAEVLFVFPVVLEVGKEGWPSPRIKQDQLELVKSAFDCCDDLDIDNKIYFKPTLVRMDLSVKF